MIKYKPLIVKVIYKACVRVLLLSSNFCFLVTVTCDFRPVFRNLGVLLTNQILSAVEHNPVPFE